MSKSTQSSKGVKIEPKVVKPGSKPAKQPAKKAPQARVAARSGLNAKKATYYKAL